MTRYDLFKLLHVVGAIAWVGGGLGLLVLHRRMLAAKDFEGLHALDRHGQALGTWLFTPAALLTVAFGVAMVATEPSIGFGELWVLIGFAGILASGVAQMGLAAPAGKRFSALAAEHGFDHPDVAAAAGRVTVGNAVDVGLLLVVVWAMVAKPVL
jgi:uncharacterized membrane protein